MIKLLFWIALIGAAYWLWRNHLAPKSTPPRRDTQDKTRLMVRCAQCGVHLPQDRAIGQGEHWFCSKTHQEQGPGAERR